MHTYLLTGGCSLRIIARTLTQYVGFNPESMSFFAFATYDSPIDGTRVKMWDTNDLEQPLSIRGLWEFLHTRAKIHLEYELIKELAFHAEREGYLEYLYSQNLHEHISDFRNLHLVKTLDLYEHRVKHGHMQAFWKDAEASLTTYPYKEILEEYLKDSEAPLKIEQ